MTDSTPAFERQTWLAWIGRQESVRDSLEIAHLKRVAATFSAPCPQHEEPLPPLWHWAFFHDPVAASQLGEDGHAVRGGFLPPAAGRGSRESRRVQGHHRRAGGQRLHAAAPILTHLMLYYAAEPPLELLPSLQRPFP